MNWNRRVDPKLICDAKHLHHATRGKIVRLRRKDGYRVWRIARDLGVSDEVIKQVLISAGWNGLGLEHRLERKPS